MQTFLQHILPQHLLSRLAAKVMQCKQPFIKNKIINWFINRYRVDMTEAENPDPSAYVDFNAFFTRALKAGSRPIDTAPNSIVSPADSTLSQLGTINTHRIFQAKGFEYSLHALLGGSSAWAEKFQDGQFATFYLAPNDYHRVHMPVTGTLKAMRYVPGRLFSVNTRTANSVPRLFARNERVICLFDTPVGEMAVILVGAMIVASIHTHWAGQIAPHSEREIQHWDYSANPPTFVKGQEIGHFQLGSTVIVLFSRNSMQWEASLTAGSATKMGKAVGTFK